MLKYEPQKFPQSMQQGPKIVIPLRPPSSRHWNIESDLTLTLAMNTHQQRLEAKRELPPSRWARHFWTQKVPEATQSPPDLIGDEVSEPESEFSDSVPEGM